MTAPAPLHSLLGGLSIPLPVHALALLNGNVFGVSGYVHRAVRGSTESLVAVAGLVLGGVAAGLIEGGGPPSTGLSLPQIAASGFLVGLGSQLSNGCTSGHMICGIARLSTRSIVATVTFFATGVITACVAHGNLGPTAPLDWPLRATARKLLVAQMVPLAISVLLYLVPFKTSQRSADSERDTKAPLEGKLRLLLRHLAFLTTSAQFALALQLSQLTDPTRVTRFLLLPFHEAFDPSLAFLAAGTMPLAMALYHYARGREIPRLGGRWTIPKSGEIDWRLVNGTAIFGVGWGLAGVCHADAEAAAGPGLVNFGHALANNDIQLFAATLWLVAMVAGGLIVP